MADDPLANAVETFSAPIEQLIIALGQGLADAQRQLDQNSVQTQEAIDADPVMSRYGLQATWYQMPSVTMQLKMALAITQDGASTPAPSPTPMIYRPRIIAQPLSAAYQTHFNYDAQAATQINLTIAPVPPPRVAGPATARLDPVKVQAIALATGKFLTTKDAGGNTVPAATDGQNNALRLDINFNGAAGLWYVLQYAPSLPNPGDTAVVVAVDDATGSARIIKPA